MSTKLSIAGTSALLFLAAAGSAGAAPQLQEPWFLDGARRVSTERVGAAARDRRGRALTPVRIRYADGPIVNAFVDETAIVELAPDAGDVGSTLAALAAIGVRAVRPLMPSRGIWLVADARGGDGLDVALRLRDAAARGSAVREVVPNLYVRVKPLGEPVTPNDPRLSGQWYFDGLKMSEAWGYTQGDAETTVVVIDTGCDAEHPDLKAKMDPGLDVVDDDDDPSPALDYDGAAHGTSCAGIAAAATDNGEGIAGGCPQCRLRCVRYITDTAEPVSNTIDAFQFALDVNASVVSNSWGPVEPAPVLAVVADAINNVFDNGRNGKGALVVFASGNAGREVTSDEMQGVRGVLSIGAINHLDEETSFTNRGDVLDLVAPTGTLTTDISGPQGYDPTDYTTTFGGTSSACPVAAGVAALLASAAPDRTSTELVELMIRTARPAPFASPDANGHDPVFGYGIIDPVAALKEIFPATDPPPVPDAPRVDDADASSGCACTAGATSRGGSGALYAVALAFGWARRRRRRPSASAKAPAA